MNSLIHWEPGWDLGRWEQRHRAGGQAGLRGVLRFLVQASAPRMQHFSKCAGPAVGWVNWAPNLRLHRNRFLCPQRLLVWAGLQQREWIHTGHQSPQQPHPATVLGWDGSQRTAILTNNNFHPETNRKSNTTKIFLTLNSSLKNIQVGSINRFLCNNFKPTHFMWTFKIFRFFGKLISCLKAYILNVKKRDFQQFINVFE